MTEQLCSMECDIFPVPYMSDKIPEDAFHGQAVKTVAYLRVSTAQQDLRRQRLAILEYARKTTSSSARRALSGPRSRFFAPAS